MNGKVGALRLAVLELLAFEEQALFIALQSDPALESAPADRR